MHPRFAADEGVALVSRFDLPDGSSGGDHGRWRFSSNRYRGPDCFRRTRASCTSASRPGEECTNHNSDCADRRIARSAPIESGPAPLGGLSRIQEGR